MAAGAQSICSSRSVLAVSWPHQEPVLDIWPELNPELLAKEEPLEPSGLEEPGPSRQPCCCCCQPPPPAEAELEEEEVLAGGWPAQAAAGIETVLVVSRELNSALCFSSRSTAVVMSSSATQLRLLSSHPSIQS